MSASISTMTTCFNPRLSLFIPRVFSNITSERIAGVFEKGNFGFVTRVDLIEKKPSGAYKSAYIHFEEWFDTTMTRSFQERVLDPTKDARVVYDDPWFWIVLENKTAKREANQVAKLDDVVPHRHQHVASVAELVAKYNPAARAQLQVPVPDPDPCMNLVSADYAARLEGEISRLRTENARLEKRTLVLELKLGAAIQVAESGDDDQEEGEERCESLGTNPARC